MTWAQGTFAYCFGIMIPVVGILATRQIRREKKPWLIRFICVSALMFLALLGCCALAIFFYPRYPREEVPELLANAFTLPGLLFGLLILRYVARKDTEPKQSERKLYLQLITVYVLGIFLCHYLFTWEFRKELPWLAHDVHEQFYTDGLLPDYGYFLKAKISEAEFRDYLTKFSLSPHTSSRTYTDDVGWLEWNDGISPRDSWWNPSPSLDATFVWQGGDTWIFAKYENGYLYLKSLNH